MKHYGVDNIWKLSDYIKMCRITPRNTCYSYAKNVDLLFFEIWESDMNKLNDEELFIYIINLLKNIKNDT